MAQYKHAAYLQFNQSSAFDSIHKAGTTAPYSGIYRCEGCGHEITSIQHHTLPPQNQHQHSQAQGEIRWRLIVTH